jgi:hypothetical protein
MNVTVKAESAYRVRVRSKTVATYLDVDATSREQAMRFARRCYRDAGNKGPVRFTAARLEKP